MKEAIHWQKMELTGPMLSFLTSVVAKFCVFATGKLFTQYWWHQVRFYKSTGQKEPSQIQQQSSTSSYCHHYTDNRQAWKYSWVYYISYCPNHCDFHNSRLFYIYQEIVRYNSSLMSMFPVVSGFQNVFEKQPILTFL